MKKIGALLVALLILGGCAAPQPYPFDLVDEGNKVYRGTFIPADNRLEVWIGNKLYQGFYVVATGVATTTGFGMGFGWRGRYGSMFPNESMTVVNSNMGRAHLQTAEGDHLNCEFLFEARGLVGECKSPQGKIYQMAASRGG